MPPSRKAVISACMLLCVALLLAAASRRSMAQEPPAVRSASRPQPSRSGAFPFTTDSNLPSAGGPDSGSVAVPATATEEANPRKLPAPTDRSSLRLPPASSPREAGERGRTGLPSVATVLGSLAVVVGLLLLVVWVLRRSLPKGAAHLPLEVLQVLGRTPLGPRQYAQLVRLGNKLLLVSVTSTGAETLAEIDDPAEVDRLAGLCQQTSSFSSTKAFRHVFSHFSREPATNSFVETADTSLGNPKTTGGEPS